MVVLFKKLLPVTGPPYELKVELFGKCPSKYPVIDVALGGVDKLTPYSESVKPYCAYDFALSKPLKFMAPLYYIIALLLPVNVVVLVSFELVLLL
jgi:hypothetical protein